MNDLKSLCHQVKSILKTRGFTQNEFSELLSVSPPTMKRWLRGEGLLFKDLLKMLDVLGVGLSHISVAAEGFSGNKFTYSRAQEEMLAEETGTLAFFDLLLKGKSVRQIARLHGLSPKSISFYLSKLDKVGLLEWLPNNHVKLKTSGEPRWLKNGPLSQKFRKQIISEHLLKYSEDAYGLRVGLYSIGQENLVKAQTLLGEVLEKMRAFEIRDLQSSQPKKLTSVILGIGHNDIPILSKIPNR